MDILKTKLICILVISLLVCILVSHTPLPWSLSWQSGGLVQMSSMEARPERGPVRCVLRLPVCLRPGSSVLFKSKIGVTD